MLSPIDTLTDLIIAGYYQIVNFLLFSLFRQQLGTTKILKCLQGLLLLS